MDMYVGIGFIILCTAILVFISGFFGYIIHTTKKEFDVSPQTSNPISKNHEEKD